MMLVLTSVEQFLRYVDGQFHVHILLLFHVLAQVVLALLSIARLVLVSIQVQLPTRCALIRLLVTVKLVATILVFDAYRSLALSLPYASHDRVVTKTCACSPILHSFPCYPLPFSEYEYYGTALPVLPCPIDVQLLSYYAQLQKFALFLLRLPYIILSHSPAPHASLPRSLQSAFVTYLLLAESFLILHRQVTLAFLLLHQTHQCD